MKKTAQYITLALLLFSNLPVQVLGIEEEVIQEEVQQEVETSDFSAPEEIADEKVVEGTVSEGKIEDGSALPENSGREAEADDSLAEESVPTETNSENQIESNTDTSKEPVEDTVSLDSQNFSNSQTVNGIRYEWNWNTATRYLDFNANDGNSTDAIQVMHDNNLIGVQHLILRNLSRTTSAFQVLNDLVTIEFFNVLTLGTRSFQDLINLREVTFNSSVSVTDSVFRNCRNLTKVNNSRLINHLGISGFYGTSVEELVLQNNTSSHNSDEGPLTGMDSLRILENNVSRGNLLGQRTFFPSLEVYIHNPSGHFDEVLTEFLNSKAPNLRSFNGRVNGAAQNTLSTLNLSNTPYLEEFVIRTSSQNTVLSDPLNPEAFVGLQNIRTVRIDGINSIGESTFRDLPNLEEVSLNQVSIIGNFAFNNTPSLKSVSAPRLKTLGRSAFANTGLEKIYFPELEETGDYPFNRNNHLREANLPNLRKTGFELFSYCHALEEVNLPRLENITHASFLQTYNLETVYLPSATVINGQNNFQDSGVKYLILPNIDLTQGHVNSLTRVNLDYLEVAYANNSEQLKSILNRSSSVAVLQVNEQNIFGDEYADLVESINTIEKITLRNTTHIGNGMFRNMTSLKEIEAPQLQEIGDETFRNSGISSIDFQGLKTVGSFAFAETNALINANLNELVTLGDNVFFRSRVESVSIPQVKELPENIFEKCTRLTEVIMPKVEIIGREAFLDTKSLRELNTPEVRKISNRAFFNSGIKYLDLPKLTSLSESVFQGTEDLQYLNIPLIQDISVITDMFYLSALPYDMQISMPSIHGIDTSMRNKSGIEVIMTLGESREVVRPLTENNNDRILAIATDGTEVLESESVINLEIGDRVVVPVRSDLIINDSIDNVKADIDHVWLHDGNPMEFGDSLVIEEVMPWHDGVYQRHLAVNYSQTNEEVFSYDSNTVTLSVSYTDELEVKVSVEDPEITIGDSTKVTATIENISGYGEVEVTVDLVSGLLGGIELVEDSITSVLNGAEYGKNNELSESIIIPQDGALEISYSVLGVNNESIENNIQVILTEVDGGEEAPIWAGASRLSVNNGRLRFTSQAPEVIEFNEWDSSNPLMLGAITTQLSTFDLEVEDLRGSNKYAQNEIQGNRSNWRVEVSTNNLFRDETGRETNGLLQLLAQTEDGNWHNAKVGVPLHTHVTNKELPLSSRFHSLTIGNGSQLGIMLNQLTGLIENSEYSVDMTFDLVDAP